MSLYLFKAIPNQIALEIPDPVVGGYDHGFRDALEAMYAAMEPHIARFKIVTSHEAMQCFTTVIDALGNNEPVDRIVEAENIIHNLCFQIEQMRGMFDDSDGTIREALDEALGFLDDGDGDGDEENDE